MASLKEIVAVINQELEDNYRRFDNDEINLEETLSEERRIEKLTEAVR